MSLWNLIRDWFVQYIWGGYSSLGDFYDFNIFGYMYGSDTDLISTNTAHLFIPTLKFYDDNIDEYFSYITIGDWLSTTSTIIVLVLLLFAFGYLIVNLFKMFSNIFSLKR